MPSGKCRCSAYRPLSLDRGGGGLPRCPYSPGCRQGAYQATYLLSLSPLSLPGRAKQCIGIGPALFAAIERLTQSDRLLLVLDELPYWVARDESVPSILQNWWDERGHTLNLMLVLCGSAVQMMERLLSGPAPLAGCTTARWE